MTNPDAQDDLHLMSSSNPGLRATLRELWLFREVVWAFGARHMRVKYKQTMLGAAWAVLQPVALLIPFAIVFGRVAKVSGGGVPYPAFALSVLVPWQFVSSATSLAAASIVTEAGLVRKVYFPREAPVIGTIGASSVDLAISVTIACALVPMLGGRASATWAFLPFLCISLLVPVLAVSLPLAALNVFYRDFRYVLPLAMQLWLFVSPVIFPLTEVAPRWRHWYAFANPVVGMLDSFRRVLTLGIAPEWSLLALSLTSSVVLLLVGYRIFRALERDFADVI